MTRLPLLLALAVAGCGMPVEDQIARCHRNGYFAQSASIYYVHCCSLVNGDRICIRPQDVTKHRRETGQ